MTTEQNEQEWLTLSQAAKYIGVSRRTIYNWVASGKLKVWEIPSGHKRVKKSSLLTPTIRSSREDVATRPDG